MTNILTGVIYWRGYLLVHSDPTLIFQLLILQLKHLDLWLLLLAQLKQFKLVLHKLNRINQGLTMDEVRSVIIGVVRSLQGLLIAHVVGIVGEVGRLGVPFACWSATALMWDLVVVGACSTGRSMFGLRWIHNQLLRVLVLSCLALIALVSISGHYLRGGLFLMRV